MSGPSRRMGRSHVLHLPPPSMLRSTLLAFCGLALLILPGCDGDGTDDGSFDGRIQFDGRSVALSGDAYFTEDRSDGTPTFVLLLTPNDLDEFDDPEFENITAIVIRREGTRPEPGLTVITAPEDDGIATAFYLAAPSGQQDNAILIAETGTMTIDEFEDGELRGTFAFSGTLFDSSLENGSVTSSINGEFEAARIVASDLPDLANSLPTGP